MTSDPQEAPPEPELARQVAFLTTALSALKLRSVASEAIFSAISGVVIGTMEADRQREVLAALRRGIVSVCNGPDAATSAMVILELDELAARLIDQVERLANEHRKYGGAHTRRRRHKPERGGDGSFH